ncbi:hypothetical protein DL96DRAFT_1563993 [Flagelloscypha sp. PMI_526]|nr:hypothetical protein DL96DRAFT_1563993 [Flagelloscypha sp. PMI_526]
MPGYQALGIPVSHSLVNITAFSIVNASALPASLFIQPSLPGRDVYSPSAYSFLISNEEKNQKVMFDLGIRKDMENFAPVMAAQFAGTGAFTVNQDITEQLHAAGTPLEAINAVIWSHSHTDHVGDMALWPSSVDLVISSDLVHDIYDPATNPNGTLLASDFGNRTNTELDFSKAKLRIGGFRALDYFKDGSLYLLSVPGHQEGHITALARVAPTTFVYLSGDTFHHVAQVRPTAALLKSVPMDSSALSSAESHVNTSFFASGGKDTPTNFDFSARSGPFLDLTEHGVYADPATSRISQYSTWDFDANDDLIVVASHDTAFRDHFTADPQALMKWKQTGLKKQVVWKFADPNDLAWRLSPA